MDHRLRPLHQQLKRRLRTTGQLFFAADKDRDNKLSFKEFERGVAMMGVRPLPSSTDMRDLFEAYDIDGDGDRRNLLHFLYPLNLHRTSPCFD